MTDPQPKRPRGRPRKVQPGQAEAPSTVVRPVVETSENPVEVSPAEALFCSCGEPLENCTPCTVCGELTCQVTCQDCLRDRVDDPDPVDTAIADAMTDASVAREHRPAQTLNALQREAWATDAWAVYQEQSDISRSDPLHRIWMFRYEAVKGHLHLLIEAKRGQQISQQLIPASHVTMDRIYEAVDAADRETA